MLGWIMCGKVRRSHTAARASSLAIGVEKEGVVSASSCSATGSEKLLSSTPLRRNGESLEEGRLEDDDEDDDDEELP